MTRQEELAAARAALHDLAGLTRPLCMNARKNMGCSG